MKHSGPIVIIEIIYLENGYTSAGIHSMGHFGRIAAPQPILYNNLESCISTKYIPIVFQCISF
jgi:hypothetical protein